MVFDNSLINEDTLCPIPSINFNRIICCVHLVDDKTVRRFVAAKVEEKVSFLSFYLSGGAIQVADDARVPGGFET